MPQVSLLDCTLRDGGYVNDWKFGHDNLICIFERLVSAGVEFIELGFIDERRPFDPDRSIAPDTESFQKIFDGVERKKSLLLGMIDFGTCGLEHIQPCSSSVFDGIRVIFKKHVRRQAVDFCRRLKEAGYKVFVQLVSITSYNEEELHDLVQLANDLNPYAVSMVDTYGLLQQDNFMYYFTELDRLLQPGIALGYHSHNNFQRAFANCTEMLSQKTNRHLLVDATIYGMGKSAGNCPIELLAMHLNRNFHKDYDITQILEALDANIMWFYKNKPWGYSMFFYVAALHDCHPNYVSYLMDKRTLSVKQICEVLDQLNHCGDKQLMYDQDLIESIYLAYQKQIYVDDARDIQRLAAEFARKRVLLLGPGKSMEQDREQIRQFIEKEDPLVVTVNYLPDGLPADYIFLSNAKRYVQLATSMLKKADSVKVIATSNVTAMNPGKFEYVLNVSPLLDEGAEIADNSLLMLLKVMCRIGVASVALAGFDGYVGEKDKDHVDKDMGYDFSKEQAGRLNRYVGKVIQDMKPHIHIKFITNTKYIDSSIQIEDSI